MKRKKTMTINTFSHVDNIIICAKESLSKPDDFGYWGSEDTFVTWGFCAIDKTRDSSIMDISNFETISKELIEDYPGDFRIESYGHWAVGEVTRLLCRVLKQESDIELDNITDAYKKAMSCKDQLNDYPVYDEDDYHNRLYKEAIGCLYDLPNYLEDMINTNVENYGEDIYYELTANMNIEFDVDGEQYPKDDDIKYAVYSLQIWNPEAIEEWNEWTDQNGLERISVRKENPNQLKLFED
jgi:hypothetical protein